MNSFRKHRADAPPRFFAAEAAGLRWLAEAEAGGGARVVRVVDVGDGWIELDRVEETRPTRDAASAFGAALARTHAAGADGFGARPSGWHGPIFIGRRELPVGPATDSWGLFYARDRVEPYLDVAVRAGDLDPRDERDARAACALIRTGAFEDDEPPARIHGDLWNGNVLWAEHGAVLIDPAAHGGHRETDLAMLALFGVPYFDDIADGYERERPLRAAWRERIPLHQLHPLAVHAAGHGPAYGAALGEAARAVLELA